MESITWTKVADILAGKCTDQEVSIRGWVHRQRAGGKIAFVTLRDGSGVVQCTIKGGIADDESLEAAKGALIESSVSLLQGTVVADERAPGGFEVKASKFVMHSRSEDFPLRGEQTTEFELDNRHLWLRSTHLSAIARIKHRFYKATRDFFDSDGFVEVDPSVITTNACEGGSTLFTFDYFGQTAYMSQSAQLYLEGCIFGNPKVYSVTPSFRAEKSRTSKHLTEFHHLEAECAWWQNEDNLVFQERLVSYLAKDIAANCADDLRLLEQDPEQLAKIGDFVDGESVRDEPGYRFGRMTYHEAAAELREMGFQFPDGEDFGVPHEKALTEARQNPVFITDWPASIKAFYMFEKDEKGPNGEALVACADLMAPGGFGEIIGGSQRSEDIEFMKQRLLVQVLEEIKEASPDDQELVGLAPDALCSAERISELGEFACASILKGLDMIDPHQGKYAGFADRNSELMHQLVNKALASYLAPYEWYFDLRRYGSVPHSGFGLGIERVLRWFTGQEHIRDMLPYPRTPSRAYP